MSLLLVKTLIGLGLTFIYILSIITTVDHANSILRVEIISSLIFGLIVGFFIFLLEGRREERNQNNALKFTLENLVLLELKLQAQREPSKLTETLGNAKKCYFDGSHVNGIMDVLTKYRDFIVEAHTRKIATERTSMLLDFYMETEFAYIDAEKLDNKLIPFCTNHCSKKGREYTNLSQSSIEYVRGKVLGIEDETLAGRKNITTEECYNLLNQDYEFTNLVTAVLDKRENLIQKQLNLKNT